MEFQVRQLQSFQTRTEQYLPPYAQPLYHIQCSRKDLPTMIESSEGSFCSITKAFHATSNCALSESDICVASPTSEGYVRCFGRSFWTMLQMVFMEGRVMAPTVCHPALCTATNSREIMSDFPSIISIYDVQIASKMVGQQFFLFKKSQVKPRIFLAGLELPWVIQFLEGPYVLIRQLTSNQMRQ